ncbi:hypothetical protein V9T40_007016 [Parthenolecanium corni]|uniref:Uncharacterized protein n=1 Tax=Parthenolecanium corni TaxID=536013 RepID=A0AAN9TVQ3_9HEMI
MTSIRVINFDAGPAPKRSLDLFPNTMRCGIFGPSGCGKTNVLLTLLVYKRPLKAVYLCSRTASQSKYELLRQLITKHNSGKTGRSKITYKEFTPSTLLTPEQLQRDSIMIFDDIQAENQDKFATFFMRGRHRNISYFYLAQSYTKIPKKSGIRENFNYLLIFPQDRINLRQIYTEHIINGVTFQQFTDMCALCWKEKYGFLTVDLDNNCKFRVCFGQQIHLS